MESEHGVHRFFRSAVQVKALEKLSEDWRERFWPLPEVMKAVERPGSLVLFFAPSPDAADWDGIIMADVGPYQADLLYVYVKESARRQGIGAVLFDALLDQLKPRRQVEDLMLEVRVSNVAARRLYEQFGMEQVGRRKKYYADGEDALVLRYPLRDPGEGS